MVRAGILASTVWKKGLGEPNVGSDVPPFPDAEQSVDDLGLDFRLVRFDAENTLVHIKTQLHVCFQQIVMVHLFHGMVCKCRANFLFCKFGSKLLAHTNNHIWDLVIILFRAIFCN